MSDCKRTPGTALQVFFEFIREMFFGQRNVHHQIPRLEFICVNRFSGVVLGETIPQIVCRPNISFIRATSASQEVDVVHGEARLRLPVISFGILTAIGSVVTFSDLILMLRRASAFAQRDDS